MNATLDGESSTSYVGVSISFYTLGILLLYDIRIRYEKVLSIRTILDTTEGNAVRMVRNVQGSIRAVYIPAGKVLIFICKPEASPTREVKH